MNICGKLLAVAAMVTLAGCATYPESINGPADPMLTVAGVRAAGDQAGGQMVRWGGIIAKVQNREGKSIVEIVGQPLTRWGRPKEGDVTEGRFLAEFDGFLDPVIYTQGRPITVIGSLRPSVEGKIGEQTYRYPVVGASGHQLWEATREYDEVYFLRAGYGWYDPFWHYPYRPVIIKRPRYDSRPNPPVNNNNGSSNSNNNNSNNSGAKPPTPKAPPVIREPTGRERGGVKESRKIDTER